MGDLILTNEAGIHNEAKTASSINVLEKLNSSVQKLLSLIRSHLFTLFLFPYSRRWVMEDLAFIYVMECSAYVFL